MKSIMSINKKFMEYSPVDLINIVKENSKYIDGFEISINYHNNDEIDYLKRLADICRLNDFHFQVHGDSSLNLEEQVSFFKILEEMSIMFDYKINVVLHSIKASSNEESIVLTTNYLYELINRVDNSKVIVSLENLNDIPGDDRLNLEQVIPIVANNEKLYLTYDIGHEISDYNNVINNMIDLYSVMSNVHIHSMSYEYSDGFDHKPIFKNDERWNDIIKAILFLKKSSYKKSIVFEYDLYACPGVTLEEKIIAYCKSIDYVSERYK